MASKMGENIQREWDEDPLGVELWEALHRRKRNRQAGTVMLAEVAERGSALAMMYLGNAYISEDGDNSELVALGERWLIQSAERGSIEGRYELANHYGRQGDFEKAFDEFQALACQGYPPAMYVLGQALYQGSLGRRSVPEAVQYLNMAKRAGHLPSMALLSLILRKEKLGLVANIKSHWLCLAKIPALAWCALQYPNSDRLRGHPRLERMRNERNAAS